MPCLLAFLVLVPSLINPSGHVVKPGMTRAEVEAAWGEPTEKRTQGPAVKFYFNWAEVWKYDFATVMFARTGGEPVVDKIDAKRRYLRSISR